MDKIVNIKDAIVIIFFICYLPGRQTKKGKLMPEISKKQLKRMPIPIDERVIIELRHLIENRTQKRMSVVAIVKMALDELLKSEAELSQ